jgi:importin subunit beta-1
LVLFKDLKVISTIASIEIPRKEWQELIPLLIQNINYTDIDIKKAAIITLGFICESLVSK